jgi:threonine aldolase
MLAKEDEDDEPWSVLVDSGYQGLQRSVNAILPVKKQANRQFTRQQRRHNQDLASERVICERYYGRLKTKFRVMSSKYRNSRDEYTVLFNLCAALTNFHTILYPL